jgi:DNA-binding response OmpR family regulator
VRLPLQARQTAAPVCSHTRFNTEVTFLAIRPVLTFRYRYNRERMMRQLAGRRILIVEDEAMVALLIEQVLVDAGATVLGPAHSVVNALALLGANMPDAAVLDMNLTGDSAAPVIRLLSARGTPFIVVTGYGDDNKAFGLPDVPVLAKPFDPDDMVAALATVLSRQDGPQAAPSPDPGS